jgi:hypothetical protein
MSARSHQAISDSTANEKNGLLWFYLGSFSLEKLFGRKGWILFGRGGKKVCRDLATMDEIWLGIY